MMFGKFSKKSKSDPRTGHATALKYMHQHREEYLILGSTTNGEGRIIELCIMDLFGNVRYSSLIKPSTGVLYPEVSVMTGVSSEMLENKPLFVEEINKFMHLFEKKIIITLNNCKKDINRELSAVLTAPLPVKWCDVMELYKKKLELDPEEIRRKELCRAQEICDVILMSIGKLLAER